MREFAPPSRLAGGAGAIGYLFKDRVGRVSEFVDALERVANGGTAMDSEVSLMAQGHANRDIGAALCITAAAV